MVKYILNRNDEGLYSIHEWNKGAIEVKFNDSEKSDYKAENLSFKQVLEAIIDINKTLPEPINRDKDPLVYKQAIFENRINGETKGLKGDDEEFSCIYRLTHYIAEQSREIQDLERTIQKQQDSMKRAKLMLNKF